MSDYELSGAEPARLFSAEVVEPLLARVLPRLRYATGRLGSGSDVLGLDDVMGRDHDWGCRLTLLVDEPDRQALPQISDVLEHELPEPYRHLPVRYPVTWDVSVSHTVDLATLGDFATGRLGVDPTAGLSVLDWLVLTGQSVLEVTAGAGVHRLDRDAGAPTPDVALVSPDVERYALAAGWSRLAQHTPMLGRTAETTAGPATCTRAPRTRIRRDPLLEPAVPHRPHPARSPPQRHHRPTGRPPPARHGIGTSSSGSTTLTSSPAPGRRSALQAAYRTSLTAR